MCQSHNFVNDETHCGLGRVSSHVIHTSVQHLSTPWLGFTGDPDLHVANWLEEGAPMGIPKEVQRKLFLESISPLESLSKDG